MSTITFQRHPARGKDRERDTVSIAGLSLGDVRLIACAIEDGSFMAGDKGGELSRALLRFASAMRNPVRYEGTIGLTCVTGGSADPAALYYEDEDAARAVVNRRLS